MSEEQTLSRVGMLGLGHMGYPMAEHLLASHLVSTVNITGRSREKLEELENAGAVWCETPRDIAFNSDILISVLPDLPQLEAQLEGANGILAGIRHPIVLLICSTSSPRGVRDLSEKLTRTTHGKINIIDAPLSGGTDGAKDGTLSIMMGGDRALYDKISPIMEACGTPLYMGDLGAGQVTKACNQMIVASTITALSEASLIAERSGIELEQLFKALAGGYAGSRLLEARKQRLIQKDYRVSGAAKFLLKDLAFAEDESHQHHVYTPLLKTLHTIFENIVASEMGEKDMSVVQNWLESKSPTVSK